MFLAIFICLILLKFVSFGLEFALLLLAGAIWLDIRIMQSLRAEYEYTIVNNDLSVDRIINMSHRKKVISIDTKSIDELGVYDADSFDRSKYAKCYDCAKSTQSQNAVFAVFKEGSSEKSSCIIMERSEKLLTTLRKCVSQNAYRSLVSIR